MSEVPLYYAPLSARIVRSVTVPHFSEDSVHVGAIGLALEPFVSSVLQGYLARKKPPTPLGPP